MDIPLRQTCPRLLRLLIISLTLLVATLANAEKGEKILDAMAQDIIKFVNSFDELRI